MKEYTLLEIDELNNVVSGTWEIDDDGVIHVNGDVSLSKNTVKNGEMIYHFGVVNGDFNCSGIRLTSLKGSPVKCKEFNCKNNYLKSLKYAPRICSILSCRGNNLLKLDWDLQLCLYLNYEFERLPTQFTMFRLELYLETVEAIKEGKIMNSSHGFELYRKLYEKYVENRIIEII